MKDDVHAVHELLKSASVARFRILSVEGEEHPDRSWQKVICHLHRDDVPWAAVPLIYTIGGLSFGDARPRGMSDVEFDETDEWRIADTLLRLDLERGGLCFEADYVRGRMVKTSVSVRPDGRLTVETRNRHEMAVRWLRALKGEKHIRLVASAGAPIEEGPE